MRAYAKVSPLMFETVIVKRKDDGKPPRDFGDYTVKVPPPSDLPKGVSIIVKP